ncbi:MAG: hypothetical protein A3B38_02895 [Candidatus Levybacteria bacterium RIFCSPLOWO2_01_FULL_36_13]|nr:MAG: hypothetical protein A2684_03985 [Candidatus Levybacteria bacterium RIFCSPHIGHO2_01_FULL_36_15b]OGH35840.1 MAG: hypothetical protein A3B38_02895 [Candidatus Levybacteria bacterium RIFCSPLOWO2_01_FULL_36_13]
MLTLTDASKETKLILKWAGIILASLLVLVFAFRTLVLIKDTFFPTPPPKPTVLFGKISQPSFPASSVNKELKFSIDTLTGELPNLTDQIKVYKIETPKADLLALKTIGENVGAAGFENGPFKVSDELYFWTDSSGNFLKTIRVNIQNGNFTMFSPFYFNAGILSAKNLPKEKEAVNYAQRFLSNMNYLSTDFDLSKTKTQLISIQDGQLVGAISKASTHAYRINFYQKNVNNYPIFYEKPNESNINVIVAGDSSSSHVVRATYILQKPSKESSTYPIKTAKEAYEELKEGKAYIASFYGESSNIKIKDVFLAYYIGSKIQDYLYPIIILEGNDGFFAYLPAVRDEWINK